jgi:hypothetical protein
MSFAVLPGAMVPVPPPFPFPVRAVRSGRERKSFSARTVARLPPARATGSDTRFRVRRTAPEFRRTLRRAGEPDQCSRRPASL